MTQASDKQKIAALDAQLVKIIADFRMLGALSWSISAQKTFLRSVKRGNPTLPKVDYQKVDVSDKIQQLKALLVQIGEDDHPAVSYVRDTAQSYLDASQILQGVGTSDVTEFSRKLYGSPSDLLPGYKRENVDVAKYFLRIVNQYRYTVTEDTQIYSDKGFCRTLQKRVNALIDPRQDPINITVDDGISARAAAGSNYVKIRKGARFSESDLEQLLHHEVLTHTLTSINGRKQPILRSMGYSAPRTTATQEGLAVFAEYANLSIELVRLKRIALRIVALDMAERGADMLDLFNFFRKEGQSEEESYYSSMRIFRGGTPKGGIIFYKDNVYLRGLIEVEAFLKRVMHAGNVHDIAILFAGKLTTSDVGMLHPLMEEGYIEEPTYIPQWARRSSELAAHLVINDLTERFKIKERRSRPRAPKVEDKKTA